MHTVRKIILTLNTAFNMTQSVNKFQEKVNCINLLAYKYQNQLYRIKATNLNNFQQ